MLNQLLKFTLVSGFLLWLRRRWKWLAGCGGVILAAIYLHGEFLDYVEAFPAGSEEAALAGEYIAVAVRDQEHRDIRLAADLLPGRDARVEATKKARNGRGRFA